MKFPLRILLIFLLSFLFYSSSFSQNSDLYLLELKNGITVKCYLKEIKEGKELIVISEDGKVITVSLDDVHKFEKISSTEKKAEDVTTPVKAPVFVAPPGSGKNYLKRNTFSNIVKAGPMYSTRYKKFYASISDVVSYEMGEISLGAGISYDALPNNQFIPVFMDLKYNFQTNSANIPFVFADLGYLFSTEIGRGIMVNAGAGVKVKMNNNINLIFDVGYKYQRTTYDLNTFKILSIIKYINANVGIQF